MAKRDKRKNRPARRGRGKMWGWLLVAAAAVGVYLLAFPPGGDTARFSDDPDTLAMGERLYRQNCATCHGGDAQGENPFSPGGGRKPGGGYIAPALNGSAHTWHHPPEALYRMVSEGSPVQDSPMRGWEGRMSDEEINSVLSYVRSLWPEGIRRRYDRMHR